jgi:hypothetical protein
MKINPKDAEYINSHTSEELKEYLHNLSVEQGDFVRDAFSPDVLIPVNRPPECERLTRIFSVNNRKYSVSGSTEAELVAAELEVHRAILGGNPPEEVSTVVVRDERGRFTSVPANTQEDEGMKAANEAEWRLKMQRGECDVATYIRETNALDGYLKSEFGLDRQAIQDKREIESWQDATKRFLASEIGSHWEGGLENQATAARLLEENPQLLESGDKVAALEAVFEYMKQNDLMAKNPDIENKRSIAEATSIEDIRAAAKRAIGQPAAANLYENWRDSR